MEVEEFKSLSKEELIDLYKSNGRSMGNIGVIINRGRKYVQEHYNNMGLKHIRQLLIEEDIENYYKSPKRCLCCGKVLDWEIRNNKFCSRSCSASYKNSHLSLDQKEKKNESIRRSIIDYYSKEIDGYDGSPIGIKIRKRTKIHNELINSKYKSLNLRNINPGECFICGSKNCNNEFCKEHNFLQLVGLAKHIGFDATTIGTDKVFNEFNRCREILFDLYWNQNLSVIEIGKLFNYNRNPYLLFNKYFNIPVRTSSESVTNAIKLGKLNYQNNHSNTFLTENHLTWYNELVFLRSSYEIDYANYLDNAKIYYEVENLRLDYFDTQQNKTRIAIPDFYLKDLNTIVEIKSDYTLDIQNMLDKVVAYLDLGYKFSLILEHEEVDIFNIDNLLPKDRLDKIRNNSLGKLIKPLP